MKLPASIKAEILGNSKTATRADSAAVADKLLNSCTIQTNLENNSAANFDGTENISVGVTGILPIASGGTGSNDLSKITVGKAISDSEGNAIVEKYQPKLLKTPFKIPAADWQITDNENFNYSYILEIENISPNDIVNINLAPESHGAAITCGLCATVEISDGFITLFAKTAPTAEILAEYYILKGAETLREIGYGAINTSTSQREIIYATPTQDGNLTYTGGELRPIWKNYDPTKLLISGEISGVDAKTYAVYFTPIGNCTWSDDTRTPRRVIWKIDKAVIQVPVQSGKLIYNGEAQTPNLLNYDSAKMILSGDFENKIDAGIYTAYATPRDNFIFEDNSTAEKIFTWQIDKAELEFSLDKNSLYLESAKISDSIVLNRKGDGVISATSADSSVATVAFDGENILVTALATGNAEITQDNLFLLSEFEIFGRQDYSNDAEQNFNLQYDYFKNGNEKIHCKHAEISTPCYWWLRTPQASNTTSFCRVDVDGAETLLTRCIRWELCPALLFREVAKCFKLFL